MSFVKRFITFIIVIVLGLVGFLLVCTTRTPGTATTVQERNEIPSATIVEQRTQHNPTTATPRSPTNLTLLHVPKTGTSFKLDIIQYQCHVDSLVQVTSALQHYHASGTIPRCAVTIGRGHDPMHIPPESTVTILRHPLKRLASGFVHDFHDCMPLIRQHGSSMRACRQIKKDMNDKNDTTVTSLIYDYARCVSGCATNMLAGHACSERPPRSFDGRLALTLESLAFIGHTDEWDKTHCSFRHHFPRHNGQPYLDENNNVRPSTDKDCAEHVLAMLQKAPEHELMYNGTVPDPDWELYRNGMALFNARMPPECIDS
mmetsp:Transcript_42137/g.101345  ORF Transcript_42137/g.101345 Transcript_42137/m.101345 type:complete len:316 (+) Transcript_42137:115-1062(+)